jgi:capsular polysaccharide biosynthesis protein
MYHLLTQYFKLIIIWGVVFAILAGGVSFLFKKQYSAESAVLLISRDRTGVDPYTQAKSAERIGESLAQIMKTTDFYTKVMNIATSSDSMFDKTSWQLLSERDQRKKWEKDVLGEIIAGQSLLKITVFADTKDEALGFSRAVTKTLVDRGWEYVSGDVVIKPVDDALVSDFPARPNIVFHSGVGFWVGFVLSSLWVVRYKKHKLFKVL